MTISGWLTVTVTFPLAMGSSKPLESTARTDALEVVYTRGNPEVAYEPSSTKGSSKIDINGMLLSGRIDWHIGVC